MGKLFLGKMNLSKIDKSKIFEGKTGKWIDITIWQNDEPDKYGNDLSIEQSVEKGGEKIYLGNAKSWKGKDETKSEPSSKMGRTTAPDSDEMPF